MKAYRQVLDYDKECEFCKRPMILITNDVEKSPTFHFCTCQSPWLHIVQDGFGKIPSFSQARKTFHGIE